MKRFLNFRSSDPARILWCLLLVLIFPSPGISQSYSVRNISVDDGLPSSFVYRAVQDPKGYMWLLTDKGVARYSGNSFRYFRLADGLSSNENWNAAITEDGSVWLNSYGGFPLSIVNGEVRIPEHAQQAQASKTSRATAFGNTIYFNAHHYDSANAARIIPYVIANDTVHDLACQDPTIILQAASIQGDSLHGAFAMGSFTDRTTGIHRTGVFRINGHLLEHEFSISLQEFWNTYVTNIHGDLKQVNSISKIPNSYLNPDTLIYLFEESLFILTKEGLQPFPTLGLDTLLRNPISRIYRLPNGFFFQSAQRSFLTDEKFRHLPRFDVVNQHHVNSLTFDDRGNFWVCTRDQGVFLYPADFTETQIFHFEALAGSDNVACVTRVADDEVVVGLDNQNLISIHQNKPQLLARFSDATGFEAEGLTNTRFHPEIGLIIGTLYNHHYFLPPEKLKEGLTQVKTSDFQVWEHHFNSAEPDIWRNLKGLNLRDSVLLFCMTGGITRFQLNSGQDEMVIESIPSEEPVYASEPGEDGTVWIGTKFGLRTHPQANQVLQKHLGNKLLQAPINAMTRDGAGNLYVGTDGLGAYMLNDDTLLHFPESKNQTISILTFSEEYQMLLAGSNRGMLILKFDSNTHYSARQFTTAHGLPSNEVSSIAVAGGKVYIGTNRGLAVSARPLKVSDTTASPRIYLESLWVNGQLRPLTTKLSLPYDSNQVEIRFSGISHASGNQVSYQFRILPDDTVWHQAGQPIVSLPSLSPGSYTVQMRMLDISNHSSPVISIELRIHRAFWKESWFQLFLLTLIVLTLLLAFEYRTKKAKKRLQAEAEIKKRFSELELQALRSQLNPHFIFNLLNSFQRIIIQEDFLLANEYLGKFAKLMRMTLESVRTHTVRLSRELELLDLYVSMEQLRFRNRFTYLLEIGPEVLVDDLEIPSLIIQPFLENAIVHGMRNLGDQGQIVLRLRMEAVILIVEVEDNGPGIAKESSEKGHTSRGIAIIRDRVAVLGQMDGIHVDIDLIDRQSTEQHPGTRAQLIFKFPDDQ